MNGNPEIIEKKENYLAGTLGALLFALAGGIVWFLLYQIGYLAGISGLVGVLCAIYGYKLFAKGQSLTGIIIAIVAAILVMVLAWYFCLAKDVYDVYQEWYANGDVDFTLTFGEAVMNAHLFLQDGEILGAYLKDLGIGLLLCIVGGFRYVVSALQELKADKETPAQEPAPQEENL